MRRIVRLQKVLLLYLFVQFVDSQSDYVENNSVESTTITSQSCDENYYNLTIESITQLEVLATQVTFNVIIQNLNTTNNSSCDNATASLSVNCSTTDNWDWIISSTVQDTKTISTNETNSFNWTIEDLAEYTTYTCEFILENDIHNTTFTTLETAPSMPENFFYDNVTATSFTLTWTAPSKVPATLLGYNLTIRRTNVANVEHYWSGCEDDPAANISVSVDNETLNYVFDEALADFNYDVDIVAWSSAGAGDSNYLLLSTVASASKQPQNVQWIITEVDEHNNVINILSLSWDMPCNTNGPVSYFQIKLFGIYKYNETVLDDRSLNESITSESFTLEIHDLMAASNYQLSLLAINEIDEVEGEAYENNTLATEENYPAEVEDFQFNASEDYLEFSWENPSNNPGNVTHYEFSLDYMERNWEKTDWCVMKSEVIRTLKENVTTLHYEVTEVIPGAVYNVSVAAVTSRGSGNVTSLTVTSNLIKPELLNVSYNIERIQVDTSIYNVTSKISIFPGCFNGQFKYYVIKRLGVRAGFSTIGPEEDSISDWTEFNLTYVLKPEYTYNITVAVENFLSRSDEIVISFTSPAGVPYLNDSSIIELSITTTTTNAIITLERSQFSDDAGKIVYLAIIVSSENVTGGYSESWDGTDWPNAIANDMDVTYYQATPERWWPFTDVNSVDYVIGENTSCTDEDTICNRPLQPETTYYVLVRAFTANYYRNSMPLKVTTHPLSMLALILGLTIGLTLSVVIAFVAFIVWKRRISKKLNEDNSPIVTTGSKTSIPIDKFIERCDYLETNPISLKEEWDELLAKTEDMSSVLETKVSLLPHNKAKNRYPDVRPYDHTRVKLCCVDEEDETSSDYINASYIKGFLKKPEYIACQGPLYHTSRDFWQMIHQENVSIIIMLTRFVEKKKEKCCTYFPKNQETLIFEPDIEVKCTMELLFDICYVRTLQVRKENTQLTVTHMQYMDWPDHGIPDSTKNIISFCHQIRKRWEKEDGLAVVHCSAGVGRTGTIIAIDILYQALQAGEDVNVFETVLGLRSQRMRMVQTQDQYLFIYMTLRDMWLNDPVEEDEYNGEHVYENIEPEHLYQNVNPNITPAVTESSF